MAHPALTAKQKEELGRALPSLKAHLADDPEHPSTGVAGVFPPWLKTIWALAGPQVLDFLEGLAGLKPAAPVPPKPAPVAHAVGPVVPPPTPGPAPVVPPVLPKVPPVVPPAPPTPPHA